MLRRSLRCFCKTRVTYNESDLSSDLASFLYSARSERERNPPTNTLLYLSYQYFLGFLGMRGIIKKPFSYQRQNNFDVTDETI